MDLPTVLALNRLNQAFYAAAGDEVSATRSRPWPGWERLEGSLGAILADPSALAVLDVGCGNARFAAFLRDRLGAPFAYLGLDSSPTLLAHARDRLARLGFGRTLAHDLVADRLDPVLGGRSFDLIAVFGLLHHIPGAATRHKLLGELAGRLRPGGALALSIWQFGARQRFRDKIVPWPEAVRVAGLDLDLGQLEPGDHVLTWGGRREALRYCHFLDPGEIRDLVAALPLALGDAFSADGDCGALNRYLVLGRPGAP